MFDCVDHRFRVGIACGILAAVCCKMVAVGVGEPNGKDERGVPERDGGVK